MLRCIIWQRENMKASCFHVKLQTPDDVMQKRVYYKEYSYHTLHTKLNFGVSPGQWVKKETMNIAAKPSLKEPKLSSCSISVFLSVSSLGWLVLRQQLCFKQSGPATSVVVTTLWSGCGKYVHHVTRSYFQFIREDGSINSKFPLPSLKRERYHGVCSFFGHYPGDT